MNRNSERNIHLPGGMVTREEALEKFFTAWKPETGEEIIDISDACGRITSKDIFSETTLPVKRTAGADGIAVHSADFAGGKEPDVTGWVPGKDYVRADTGDDFPDEFDAIVPAEWLTFSDSGALEKISLPKPDGFDPKIPGFARMKPQSPGEPLIRPGSF